ncbi:MAG: CCXG family PEP-CTERM protein, partial [Pseudomonadota bacterium]
MRALLLVWLILVSNTALAYWDCYWPFRTPVTITASAAVPNNYQVRININNDLHAGYNWSDAGNDLRVLDSDDNSELDFWIDRWDATNKSASVWVRFPTLTTSSRTIYLYYGNKAAAPITQVPPVFTYSGIRFHTRNTSADPRNYNDAVSAFESAPDGRSGYGCKFITNFTNITNANQFPPGGSDFGARSESYFEVKPGEAGFWEFRYGSDFGRGGGLFINSTPLEEQWNDDLWWNNSWSNSDVLQGGISLTAGYHKLEVLGFEGCCDGGITVQFRKPGGSWQTFTTGNID